MPEYPRSAEDAATGTGTLREQLRRFNEERERMLGRPPAPGHRMPLPYTYVGGDLPEEPG